MNSHNCIRCNKVVDIVYDKMCEECYDDEYSGCYGGGCIGGDTDKRKEEN